MLIFKENMEGIPTESTWHQARLPQPHILPTQSPRALFPHYRSAGMPWQQAQFCWPWTSLLTSKACFTKKTKLWRFPQDKKDGAKQGFTGRYVPCSLSAECILTGVLQGSGISEEKQVTSYARKTSSSCRAGTWLPSLPQRRAAGF